MHDVAVPVLAHLGGAALGGGLEVALMADVRTAAPGVRGIGLPETSLGILPAWGGTSLLSGLIGAEAAVRMILEDPARQKQLTAEAAVELGLVNALAADLDAGLDVLATRVAEGSGDGPRPATIPVTSSDMAAALDAPHSPAETRRTWARRQESIGAPSLARVVDLLDELPGRTLAEALSAEESVLTDLLPAPATSASLYAAELLRRSKPSRTPVEGARSLAQVGVAGAGLMASQIAAQLALGLKVPVVLRDLDSAIAQKGLAHAREVIIQAGAGDEIADLLSATDQVADLSDCDLVLEAVPEVLGIKQTVFAELEQVVAADAVLATNTSSLSVAAMGEHLAHPERLVGLHFFNPVARMPLVEVIRTPASDPISVATAHEVARRCRKTAVEAADAPGFVVNRLLFRILSAVLASLDAGADPEAVNASLDEMGLPMRPLALLDLVGTAVADHVGTVLADELGAERFPASPGLARMVGSGEAFTVRSRERVHAAVSPAVTRAFGQGTADGQGSADASVGPELLHHVLDGLAEEIGLMLDEGVVASIEEVDLALMLGAGFPTYRGGVTPYLDQAGASDRVLGHGLHGER
jgi:3-hydroxyacyl-CoA dehydrogenase/enoyl-CoA hydratase/carnithine racemase